MRLIVAGLGVISHWSSSNVPPRMIPSGRGNMLDPDGRVTNWNAGAERIKGYAPDEIIGQHFSRFYTPEDFEAGVPKRALETARKTGRYEAEGWRVRKDGTHFWASVVIDAIKGDNGELIGFAKITRDMAEIPDGGSCAQPSAKVPRCWRVNSGSPMLRASNQGGL